MYFQQYWFSKNALKFFTETIKKLKFDGVLCIGCPRLFENLQSVKDLKLFLLDYDIRLVNRCIFKVDVSKSIFVFSPNSGVPDFSPSTTWLPIISTRNSAGSIWWTRFWPNAKICWSLSIRRLAPCVNWLRKVYTPFTTWRKNHRRMPKKTCAPFGFRRIFWSRKFRNRGLTWKWRIIRYVHTLCFNKRTHVVFWDFARLNTKITHFTKRPIKSSGVRFGFLRICRWISWFCLTINTSRACNLTGLQ